MDKNQQFHLWYFLAAFMILLRVQSWLSQASHETLGQAVLVRDRGGFLGEDKLSVSPRHRSEATAREVDLAVRGLLGAAYDRAVGLLRDNHADLQAGARLLLERETITPAEFAPLKPGEVAAA